jgi:hypothetical protein
MFVCPRCRGLVPSNSAYCPTCAYDPRTGDTAVNPPRESDEQPVSKASIVVSGLSMLIAIGLVIFAIYYALQSNIIVRPDTNRSFATESGTTPTSINGSGG